MVGTDSLKRSINGREAIIFSFFCPSKRPLSHVSADANITKRIVRVVGSFMLGAGGLEN